MQKMQKRWLKTFALDLFDFGSVYELYKIYLTQNKNEAAEECLQSLKKRLRNDEHTSIEIGTDYAWCGLYEGAIEFLSLVETQNPLHAYYKAYYFHYLGNEEKEKEFAQLGFSYSPDREFPNGIQLGNIHQSMSSVKTPSQLTLTVSINSYQNSWNFFVYPVLQSRSSKDILITQELNDEAIKRLNEGGKVLLTLKKGTIKKEKGGDIAIGFSSIFWNTSWTHHQPPHTLGILCNPKHAAFKYFPTDYYSN